jgi:hypothetical protein
MKKLVLLLLLFLPLVASSQAFFKSVDKDMFSKSTDRSVTSVWLVRPYFNITALQVTFGETTTVKPLSSAGTGVSYSLFKEVNGEPYQVFAANLAVLFGTDITEISPLEVSVAATVTGFQYVSIGGGWDFMNKNFFLLTSFTFNFNN